MCLHILHNPLSLESGGVSIHQAAASPYHLAAASKLTSSEVTVGNSVIAASSTWPKELLVWNLSSSFLSAQDVIRCFVAFILVAVTLTVTSRAIARLLVTSLKVYTLGFFGRFLVA